MQAHRYTLIYVLLMTLVVVASNILVQFPVQGTLGAINLADILTYGAFTYPFAFLVTDLTNRHYGPAQARIVVLCGFVTGVLFSALGGLFSASLSASTQIAFASGLAFLLGQLLDISVFNRLRRQTWWHAPLAGSMLGSILDTAIFFSLAFAPAFAIFAAADAFANENAPILGVLAIQAPRWISWALGDLAVKVLFALLLLMPYGALMSVLKPMPAAQKA
jgi:queuosine precursor transporter